MHFIIRDFQEVINMSAHHPRTIQLVAFFYLILLAHHSNAKPDHSSSPPNNQKQWTITLPDNVNYLPIWSTSTKTNKIECNANVKSDSNGWVIKQWKNHQSLCLDTPATGQGPCASATSEFNTTTSKFCYWQDKKTILFDLNSRAMPFYGCKPNSKGNVGGYVNYLSWEPKIIPGYFDSDREKYMVRNMKDITISFDFANRLSDVDFRCPDKYVDKVRSEREAVIHSYATSMFSEIDPKTRRGTGRTIFYQVLTYDSRREVRDKADKGAHEFVMCNYRSNKHSTMIFRDTAPEFGYPLALPIGKNSAFSDHKIHYQFNLLERVSIGLSKCYKDYDFDNFKFTGFHIGNEIINGAIHSMEISNPKIEIQYR